MTTSFASINHNKKIAIFYHLYQYANWTNLFIEQFNLLKSSGLYDICSHIHIGINGSESLPFNDIKIKINYNSLPWTEETQTLISLRDFCKENNDWQIFYFHTKGITQPSKETEDWRNVMQYFCIEKWRDCIQALEKNDTAGCLFMDDCYYGFFPHYSGNFWWANSNYIQQLDDSYLFDGIRQNREFWIGTGSGLMYSFLNTGLNHYAVRFPRNLYARSID